MTSSLWLRVRVITCVVMLISIIHIFNIILDGQFNQYGIIPRSPENWYHIITAPFIHGSYWHLINNIIGLSIFSAICLVRPVSFYLISSLIIILVTGILVWLFGREASHIGASGWIFGLWSLSITIAWFDRSFKNIAIALFVIFFYGGMIYGILPIQTGVSFESHLFGVVAGVVCGAIATKTTLLRRSYGRL